LLEWYEHNRRDLPWRCTRDPYRILVSEIMLQQTRAEVVIPYYQRFLERFPDAATLAQAKQADVLACWSGLGYYSRARNLQAAARAITASGGFPRDYHSLRALPGVGPYTAAAVSSIAFDQPCAVLDGNVLRVIARITNDGSDIALARTRAQFQRVADGLLAPECPGDFNQAMMELGATICLPRAPGCTSCPVARFCEACKAGTQGELPVKSGKLQPQTIRAEVVIVEKDSKILLHRRAARERRMAGFWDLPQPAELNGLHSVVTLGSFRHTITHHHYTLNVLAGAVPHIPRGFRWWRLDRMQDIPLSTIARKAIRLRHPRTN